MPAAIPIFSAPGRALTFDAPDYINPLELDAPELIAWLEEKEPRAIGSWRELGIEEYARAFTAARTMGYDVVGDLYDGFRRILETPGATGDDFAAQLIPILRRKGWMPDLNDEGLSRRLGLIYETNLRLAQATGRWARIQRNKLALPYLLGVTAKDERVRHPPKSDSDHTAFEGILLPVDHPFWLQYFPPLGFRCRCSVVQRSRSQIARLRHGITSDAELALRQARIGPSWGFNPESPLAGVNASAERANAARMEGAPPINPEAERQLASNLWSRMAAQSAGAALEALLAKIFG